MLIGGDGTNNHTKSSDPFHNSDKNIRNAKGTETDRSCSNCGAKDGSRDGPGASEYEGGNQGRGKEEDVDETDLSDECCIVGNVSWGCRCNEGKAQVNRGDEIDEGPPNAV